MKQENNTDQLTALFLAFTVIGSIYGIIFLFGMLIGVNQ